MKHFRVVLSHTSHPGNIGSTARAMKTMGLTRLYLVNPQEFPSEVAVALASSADDVLNNAVICSSVEEALRGTTLQVAMTARRRELTQPLQTPRQLVPELLQEANSGGEVALLFGPETSGLTIDEVRQCNRLITIPTNPDYSSLNLSQAVQVLTYEIRSQLLDDVSYLEKKAPLASHEYLELYFEKLEETLLKIGFLKPYAPKRLMPRLRRLYQRATPEQEEVDILRGILRATLEYKLVADAPASLEQSSKDPAAE
ncbi:RNA methyltransferase [Chitinilyticum litopenaei]|uniref:tRNA (cytidine/uridine-2'-O-)-methyltransferase TrmJ n=1 Tax=Chitinilyticum piscinae TaxID=2866724 RepID=A0A8J7FN63_9NEIS|nr:RNA methyltransferase [Chitinilyticum piscinae]